MKPKLMLVDQAERYSFDRDGNVVDHHFELRIEADFPMNWSVEEVVCSSRWRDS